MRNRWSDESAAAAVARWGAAFGEDLALRTYTSRLLGAEPDLVLHGGGNTSLKADRTSRLGRTFRALFVKASGVNLGTCEPGAHTGLELDPLLALRALEELPDEAMVEELMRRRLRADGGQPSLEALVHAFLPAPFVDHTHADAILALTNQEGGEALVRSALGEDVLVIPYVEPGFRLARAAAGALDARPSARAMVWGHHGLVTWGATARESYEATIALVSRAEAFLEARGAVPLGRAGMGAEAAEAAKRYARLAPVLRGLLGARTADPDRPWRRAVLAPLLDPDIVTALGAPGAREMALTAPLTTDHLIRVKALPLWVDGPDFEDEAALRAQLADAIERYAEAYEAYVARNAALVPPAAPVAVDPLPRVVLIPGVGAIGAGADLAGARLARDVAAHTLRVKARIAAMGGRYEGLPEGKLFFMEYRGLQQRKLGTGAGARPLRGSAAIVTGAAGAIGSAICRALLEQGALVAVTDLAGEGLDGLVAELQREFGDRALGAALDVGDPASVASAFARITREWGGVDLVVANAGLAHVAPLAELDLEAFRRLTRVNVEGTLLVLAEAARLFARQGTGGDVVLISTKNVPAPGASFGAYSATKAGAHQLARIASLELAPLDVRVNMVAPDGVFSEGARRSGLWARIGPDRARARGLPEAELEEYYRNRNLLKARITGAHVAKAVLWFATRQVPNTGITLPVDGGLPDATPR